LIAHYFYFIIASLEFKTITLWTFDNRGDLTICTETQQLIYINEFSLFYLKWEIEPIIPKKHKDFYDCIMHIGIFYQVNLFGTYIYKNQIKINEFFLDFMKALSKHLNFFPSIKSCGENDCSDHIEQQTYIYNILTVSNIDAILDEVRWMHVMMNIECTLVQSNIV